MTFVNLEDVASRSPLPGATARFVHSGHMTCAYWRFEPDTSLPEHAHPHEQVTTILEGEFELTVDGETRCITPGDVAVIAPNAPHSGRAVTKCYILDVFHPVREDYR